MPALYPEKLAQHLDKTPAALYWVAGDDPLLTQEACDTVRQSARQHGFDERKVFFPEKTEHWLDILTEANSLSLFSSRTLLDVRCALGKVNSDLLLEYLRRPNPDTLILLQTPRPDAKSALKKALEPVCAFVPVYDLSSDRFPDWLTHRARRLGLELPHGALALLAEQTEGNLLAAQQELDKLSLRFGKGSITLEQMESEVADNARFSVFALNDSLLAGHTHASLRILQTLKQEGTAPLAILGALQREWRQLASATHAVQRGQPVQPTLARLGVWDKRQPLFQRALKRLTPNAVAPLHQTVCDIDLAVKGMHPLDPWTLLQRFCVQLCQPAAHLPA